MRDEVATKLNTCEIQCIPLLRTLEIEKIKSFYETLTFALFQQTLKLSLAFINQNKMIW